MYQFSEERVARILNEEPTAFAVARVTTLTSSSGRRKTFYYALIEYQTPGKVVMQRINNDNKRHYVDEMLDVEYSVTHPDMFFVIEK